MVILLRNLPVDSNLRTLPFNNPFSDKIISFWSLKQKVLNPNCQDGPPWSNFSEIIFTVEKPVHFVKFHQPDSSEIKNKLIIKLPPRTRFKYIKEDSKWLEFDPKLKMIKNINIDHLILHFQVN